MPTGNPNILFRLSGLSGLYIFDQNPVRYDIYTPKKGANVLGLLEGENIYQRSLLDNNMRKMEWDTTSYSLYSGLRQFAYRGPDDEPPVVYFWDGTVYEFQGAPIQVIDVYGRPIAGNFPKWHVEMQFKWVQV